MGLNEMVRAQREAAESSREPLQNWCMPVNSRQGAQTLTRRWGNHTNISPGPARADVLGKVLCLDGDTGLGWLEAPLHAAVKVASQPCSVLGERERWRMV